MAGTKSSAVARTAVYQWNNVNIAVRMLVHKTKVRYNVIIIHNVVIIAVLIHSFVALVVCCNVKALLRRRPNRISS